MTVKLFRTNSTLFFRTNIIYIMRNLILIATIFLLAFANLKSQYIMPSGGEDGYDWRVGTTQVITWSIYFMDTTRTIDILLWNADEADFSTIAKNIPVTAEYYLWDIPGSHPTGEQFKVKIIYHNGFLPKFKYISDDFFSIKEQMRLSQKELTSSPIIARHKTNSFTLYPNPASNVLHIESSNKFFSIEIYDVHGSLVSFNRFDYTNNYQLDLITSKLAQGTYTVLVRFMGDFVTEQLIIAK